MRVGHGSADLHVPDGTPMGGYLDRPGPSAGLLDPLSVEAVTWFDGERRFALATADVICVNEDLANRVRSEVRSLGCELWLAATHTHSGPETGCVPGGGPTPGPWLDRVSEAVGTAVRRAIDDERPCDGEARHGELHGVGADRSRPSAPAVVPLTMVTAHESSARDERVAGVLVVLPVHPTVLPAGSRLVSADLAGAVRRALRARLGPGVWAVVATGAAGDISTRHTRRGQDAAELDRLAGMVADRCLELLREPAGRAWSASSRVAWAARRLTLDPAGPGAEAVAADPAELARGLRAAEESGDPVAVRMARSRLEGVRARAGRTDPIGVHVHTARVGELSVAGLPGEPFLAVAGSIAAKGPVMVLGYVNGYPGYLPTAEAYGRAEYEVLVSQVAPGSAEALAEAARQLLEDM